MCHVDTILDVQVIELQKRGLPHAHILIILAPEDKPETVDDVDATVCAEISDPAVNPRLHDTVCSMMLHGHWGAHNPRATCMENGKCTKGYPKSFQECTQLDQTAIQSTEGDFHTSQSLPALA